MTVPRERAEAILVTRNFLINLSRARAQGGYKGIPKYIRIAAHKLLRHYPSEFDLERLAQRSPDILDYKMPREEAGDE